MVVMAIMSGPGSTIPEPAGVAKPAHMQGYSLNNLLKDLPGGWKRRKRFYEYYWEAAFPQTPTTFAVRSDRYKYIYNNGVCDINDLFDLAKDPYEMNNLARDTGYRKIGLALKEDLFKWLQETNGLQIPLKKTINNRIDHIYRGSY